MKNYTNDTFIDFLIEEDALYNYLYNVLNHIHIGSTTQPLTVGSLTFYWIDTSEGFNYWDRIFNIWAIYG